MAENYLITGYWGEPHVTAENDRGFNAAVFGPGRFVLPVGEQLRAAYIGNNTVRIYDGKLLDNGALAGIPAGKYVDLLIPEAGQGMNRNDLIVFQYKKNQSTLVESGEFIVLRGNESSGAAFDPFLEQQDLLTDEATIDQMALWRISVSGANISAPAAMFTVPGNLTSKGVTISTTAVIGTAWGGASPYTQSVRVDGMLATDRPHISPVYSDDMETALAQREAWGKVCDAEATTNYVIFRCFEEMPEIAIPIQIEVVR